MGENKNGKDLANPIPKKYVGRRVITTSAKQIDESNLMFELGKALNIHNQNSAEIDYLWKYYKGDQPILNRVKTVRPEICNRIVENRANEIVSFKVGYLCGEPIQYISRSGSKESVDGINTLNDYMFAEDKLSQDQELVEWAYICGTAYRLVMPDNETLDGIDESPFEMETLDPRHTFVVYSNAVGKKPLMGVKYYVDIDTRVTTYSIYTEDMYYEVEGDILKVKRPHILKMVPIFEYPANNARLGSFEIALPLLDAMNNVASNRMDAIEQTVQAFIKFINCDITSEDFKELRELGAIKVKSTEAGAKAEVDVVKNDLDQSQTQVTKDDLYNAILTICGVPSRNNGSAGADTGKAVELRDGWSLVEARAKDSETIFKKSERQMLKLVLLICNRFTKLNLKLKDIDLKFTRRNYDNIQTKAQVLDLMLGNPKIHPLQAYMASGLFSDAESAYQQGMDYYKEAGGREIALNKSQTGDNLNKQTNTEGTV